MTKSRSRRVAPSVEDLDELWPVLEAPSIALGDPEIGLEASEFHRWRRGRSDPPPSLYDTPRPRRRVSGGRASR